MDIDLPTAAVAILLLVGLLYADDLTKYCPTVEAIYGVCSPELVNNYIAHINDTYKRPGNLNNESVTVAIPPGTVPAPQDQNNLSLSHVGDVTPGAQKPVCFCDISDAIRCVENEQYVIKEAYNEKCEIQRRKIMQLPPITPWYADKMYMVS
jgi:hypothetical protein